MYKILQKSTGSGSPSKPFLARFSAFCITCCGSMICTVNLPRFQLCERSTDSHAHQKGRTSQAYHLLNLFAIYRCPSAGLNSAAIGCYCVLRKTHHHSSSPQLTRSLCIGPVQPNFLGVLDKDLHRILLLIAVLHIVLFPCMPAAQNAQE